MSKSVKFGQAFTQKNTPEVYCYFYFLWCLQLVAMQLPATHHNVRKINVFGCSINAASKCMMIPQVFVHGQDDNESMNEDIN